MAKYAIAPAKALRPKKEKQPKAAKPVATKTAPPTNYLAPLTPQEIMKTARQETNAIYKPSFAQLQKEEARLSSVNAKRQADNELYKEWLTNKVAGLTAQQALGAAQVGAANQNDAATAVKNFEELHNNLVAGGNADAGSVSNPGEATAFDTTGAAQRAGELGQVGDQQINEAITHSNESGVNVQANTYAFAAANEAKRQAENWEQMGKLGDAKQQLQLSKAAEAAKAVEGLWNREIQKAQIRGGLKQGEAEALLAAEKLGLDTKKFGLEVGELGFAKEKFGTEAEQTERKLGIEEKDSAFTAKKFGLSVKEYEEDNWYDHVKAEEEAAKIQISGSKTGKEAKAAAEKKHIANQKITARIQEGTSYITSHPQLQKAARNDAINALMKVLGSSVAASAAYEVYHQGQLSPGFKKELKAIGYTPPPQWR